MWLKRHSLTKSNTAYDWYHTQFTTIIHIPLENVAIIRHCNEYLFNHLTVHISNLELREPHKFGKNR